ncbi:MAG: glycerophosphodiester phosphodiesterase family protein [Alphaproteobacteria bacterium]|nr:glycerophosphodiester phosphodiesterase family protein [Alphaproteobacteria bacterium]
MRGFLRWVALAVGALFLLFLALAGLNASFWSAYTAPTMLLAHRGLAQTYPREGLTSETCTATRIHAPEHPYLENTIASMRAAFALGAGIVEFDVHPTTDGAFAVFHDWTIDCRTQGKGVTREQAMAYLKTLDIGYGYTADGGKTHPFRGKGVGLMPTLDEVLATFPTRRFLIHIKSNDPAEANLLAARLKQLPPERVSGLIVYGGDRPIERLRRLMPAMRLMSKASLFQCGTRYIAYGWTGAIPDSCRNTIALIPANVVPFVWGWPNLFLECMASAGTPVFVTGPFDRRNIATGIDDLAAARQFPFDFPGGIWTNRIDRIAPHFGRQPACAREPGGACEAH